MRVRRPFLPCGVAVLCLGALLLAYSTGPELNAQSSSRCAPFPAFPDASCTGTLSGIARTATSSITTSSNGQVIQNLDITGRIQVNHNNVTIRNVKITTTVGTGDGAIQIAPGATGTLIEDCELNGAANTGAGAAVYFGSYTIRRCNIHSFGEGLTAEGGVLAEDNYMHSFKDFVAGGAHQDGIQNEFSSNVTMRHNTCLMNVNGANSCFTNGNNGVMSNNIIENNLISGGSYAITFGNNTTGAIRNNHFSTLIQPNGGYWGPITGGASATRCGNRWHDGSRVGQLLSGEAACPGETVPPAAPTNLRITS